METKKNQETKLCKYCRMEIPKKAKVCPNCRKKQSGIFKWIAITVIVLAIIGAASGGDEIDDSAESSSNSTRKEQSMKNNTEEEKREKTQNVEKTEEIIYTPYTVTHMMEELNSNAMKAESTYENQYVEITGRLGVIDSDGNYITLYPEDDEFAIVGVQCNIKNEEQKQKIMEMSKDDIVTLRGKIKSVGEVMGYSLDVDGIN